MDRRSLERFRKALKQQRSELHLRLVAAIHHGRTLDMSESKDEGERAGASITIEMSAMQQTQAENLLKAVNGALDRIDAGTFGECRNCGHEIGLKRLDAVPWTRYCITCQELIDGH